MPEQRKKTKTLQHRIGQRSPQIIKDWYDNQNSISPNDAMRELMELIISLVGVEDIRSTVVYERIAKLKKNNPNYYLENKVTQTHTEKERRAARPTADELDF